MVSSKEKRNLIKALIEQPDSTNQIDTIQMQLHSLLLRDTNNGKLYKYRRFDPNGYSLDDLRNGTLYCSKPDSFNDPFDCKIGITFESLYRAKYETEFDLVGIIIEKFILVVQGKLDIDTCNSDEQRIIKTLLSHDTLVNFIVAHSSIPATEEEGFALLQQNPMPMVEMLHIIFSDIKFRNSLGVCVSLFPELFDNLSSNSSILKADHTTLTDFARDKGITDDIDEISMTMLLSEKISPDLAPARKDILQLIDNMEHQLSGKMANMFLVGCLCTDFKNRLMWSHYAESHTGFCVEYDYSEPTPSVLSNLPVPVFYSSERPLVPWKAALENTSENISEACTELMLGVLTKDSAWEYENEWRILLHSTDNPHLKMPKISCVYLGAAISEDNKKAVLDIALQKNIPVKQMTVDRGAYSLHATALPT